MEVYQHTFAADSGSDIIANTASVKAEKRFIAESITIKDEKIHLAVEKNNALCHNRLT